MSQVNEEPRVIGRAENVSFPELDIAKIPARIDTGAKTSALWASDIMVKDGILHFTLFDEDSEHFTGHIHTVDTFEELVVASSNGATEKRHKIKLLVKVKGKKIRAAFTLANRSSQVYPVLIGRNVLLGKFVVDVKKGKPQRAAERKRSDALQSTLKEF